MLMIIGAFSHYTLPTNLFIQLGTFNEPEFMSIVEILVSKAATLTPFGPFDGIFFRKLVVALIGLNARAGEPTINNPN